MTDDDIDLNAHVRPALVYNDLVTAKPGDVFSFEQEPGRRVLVVVARVYPANGPTTVVHTAPPVPGLVYLLWSQAHNAWWKPGGFGYHENIDEAGRFTEAEAVRYVVASAQSGIRDRVTFMVAAPDNWAAVVHASPSCACGVNDAGQRFVDPICRVQESGPPLGNISKPPRPPGPQPVG